MNFLTVTCNLKTQKDCIEYLELVRWKNIPTCPYCQSKRSSKKKNFRYSCLDCKNSYRVTVGTIFESSRLPLTKWFKAFKIIFLSKKYISARELSRLIQVKPDTALLLKRKIQIYIYNLSGQEQFGMQKKYCNNCRGNKDRIYHPSQIKHLHHSSSSRIKNLFKKILMTVYQQISIFYYYHYIEFIKFKDKLWNKENVLKKLWRSFLILKPANIWDS